MDWMSRPVADEDPLAHHIVKGEVTLCLGLANPPRNWMYFREFDGSCRAIDADPKKTIGSLAPEFQKVKRPVYFELDGTVLDMDAKAEHSVHPLNPISVFYVSSFLPVVKENEGATQTVFVQVDQGTTVTQLGVRLGFPPGNPVFTCGSRVLSNREKLFEQNPTGLQVSVKPPP
jgi:hypothetical protein